MVSNSMKKKILIVLSIIVTSIVLLYTVLLIYIGDKAKQDTKVKSDVIVVLGEGAYGGISCYGSICQHGFVPHPQYNPCLVVRVDHAVSLYKNHYAPKILMSGGTDKEDNVNEAETMKKIAIEAGVPGADILMEKESTSTYENLALSQKILNKAGLHSIIIVTDPYTNARTELVAEKLHYNYSLSPAINTPCSHPSEYLLREPLAIIAYKLLNKI
jgi:uncharacterized SAM-binding protein YcdF (DUF218 family)